MSKNPLSPWVEKGHNATAGEVVGMVTETAKIKDRRLLIGRWLLLKFLMPGRMKALLDSAEEDAGLAERLAKQYGDKNLAKLRQIAQDEFKELQD